MSFKICRKLVHETACLGERSILRFAFAACSRWKLTDSVAVDCIVLLLEHIPLQTCQRSPWIQGCADQSKFSRVHYSLTVAQMAPVKTRGRKYPTPLPITVTDCSADGWNCQANVLSPFPSSKLLEHLHRLFTDCVTDRRKLPSKLLVFAICSTGHSGIVSFNLCKPIIHWFCDRWVETAKQLLVFAICSTDHSGMGASNLCKALFNEDRTHSWVKSKIVPCTPKQPRYHHTPRNSTQTALEKIIPRQMDWPVSNLTLMLSVLSDSVALLAISSEQMETTGRDQFLSVSCPCSGSLIRPGTCTLSKLWCSAPSQVGIHRRQIFEHL